MVRANKNWEIIPYFCFFFANSSSTVIRFNTMFSIFPYCHVVITENKNQQNRYQLWCLNPFFSKMRTKSFYSDWLITTDINIWCWTTVFRLDFSFKVKSTDRLNFNIKIRPWVRPPNYAIFYLKTIQVCSDNFNRMVIMSKYYIPVSGPFLTRICIKVLFLFALFTFWSCSRRKCFHIAWTNKRPIIITKSNSLWKRIKTGHRMATSYVYRHRMEERLCRDSFSAIEFVVVDYR